MNYSAPLLWLVLSVLCLFTAIEKMPSKPVVTPSYHVAYGFDTGFGAITMSFAGPITETRIGELRDTIAADLVKNHGKTKPVVVINAIIPLAP